jgi:D-glycerate 3-kinase
MPLAKPMLHWHRVVEPLAGAIAASPEPALRLGISGAQGSGKSTLTLELVAALRRREIPVAACSLDDFYLTRRERRSLAASVHPLLATRGVPGTHDVALCQRILAELPDKAVRVPHFDKGSDDRVVAGEWSSAGPARVVILEGWCVGARPQSVAALTVPVNALERDEDPDGRWRRYVNAALAGAYQRLFDRLDYLVYLAVPDFEAVARWRGEQELALPQGRRMDTARLERFIAHYERLTRWMLEEVPARADMVVRLTAAHGIASLITNRPL